MKKLFYFLIPLISIAGLCACGHEDLDGINKSSRIASVSSQIGNIQASLSKLESIDSELKVRIDMLSRLEVVLETFDNAKAKETAILRESSLRQAESTLSKRIDDLKTYVDDDLKLQTDWEKATYTTLEQSYYTYRALASVKLDILDMDGILKGLVSGVEASVKSWVNVQFTGYYSIAQVDAKVITLEKTLAGGFETQSRKLAKLKADSNDAITDISNTYERAITDAIINNEGQIDEKAVAGIKVENAALQSRCDVINAGLDELESIISSLVRKYKAWIGQWTIYQSQSEESIVVTISQQKENSTYNIDGLEGIDTAEKSLTATGVFEDDGSLSIYSQKLGTWNGDYGPAQDILAGLIVSQGVTYYFNSSDYLITNITLSSDGDGIMSRGFVKESDGTVYSIVGMKYYWVVSNGAGSYSSKNTPLPNKLVPVAAQDY